MKQTISTLLLLSVSSLLTAQTILIDFGKSSQPTAGNWNNFAQSDSFRFTDNTQRLMLEDMIDSTGAATTADFYFIDFSDSAGAGIGGADFNLATTIGQPQSATRDTMYLNRSGQSAWASFELRGLTANAAYDLTFFAGIAAERNDTEWTADGTTVSLAPENNTTQTVTIAGARANASGVLSILWESNTGAASSTAAHWNTLEIVAVPEPSAYSLLVAITAASTLLVRRPRNRYDSQK